MIRIYENNLIWSQRLRLSLDSVSSQFEAKVPVEIWSKPISNEDLYESHPLQNIDIAIVNLGATHYDASKLIAFLKRHNVKVIAHAGHKEGTLLDTGKSSGADIVATNRELTARASALVEKLLTEA